MALDQEYLTGNRRIRYPFADDSVLPVDDRKALLVFGCFIDVAIQPKRSDAFFESFIKGISINNNTISFTLACDDGLYEDVPLTCTKTHVKYPIVKGQSSWCWYTFVMSSDGIQEYSEAEASSDPIGDISGSLLYFNRKCCGYSANEVMSIQVYNGEGWNDAAGRRYTRSEAIQLPPDWTISGDVRLQTGYNMSFSEDAGFIGVDITDTSDKITLNAVPGAGMGRLPCDCYDTYEFKTPGLLSKDGHVRLFNDTCYDIFPVKSSEAESYLRMHAKCKACCTCQMYADIVNQRLVPLKNELLSDKVAIQTAYSKYESSVAKWNYRINNAFEEDIVISATAVPLDAAGTELKTAKVAGRMSRCGFSVMVRNDSFVYVDIDLTDFSTNGEFFEAQLSYMNEQLRPVVAPISLERGVVGEASVTLPPGRSATFTCFIRSPMMVQTDSQTGFIANVRVTAKQGDREIMSKIEGIVV